MRKIFGESARQDHTLRAIRSDQHKRRTWKIHDCIWREKKLTLTKRDQINFTGFGKFATSERKARMGVNPRNPGQKVHIPAATVPKFTAGSALKQAVRG